MKLNIGENMRDKIRFRDLRERFDKGIDTVGKNDDILKKMLAKHKRKLDSKNIPNPPEHITISNEPSPDIEPGRFIEFSM